MEDRIFDIRRRWLNRTSGVNKLDTLLLHACDTVPYYQKLNKKNPLKELSDFPILAKPSYRNSNMFSSLYLKSELIWHSTSGSTGEPLKIAWDIQSAYAQNIDMKVVQSKRMGIDFHKGKIGIILMEDNPETFEGIVHFPTLNNSLYQRIIIGKDNQSDYNLIKYLRSIKIPLLCARPRSLLRLMQIDRKYEIGQSKSKIIIKSIRSSGDNLYQDQCRRIEHWFNCNVYNSYQSQEGGLIGMDCHYKKGLHLFNDKSIIEVLNIDTGKVTKGGFGIAVITNLENWALPFIRYKTDDYISIQWTECKCGYKGYTITEITGRNSPYFYINDKKFNPTQLNKIFEKYPVHQYQVIQTKESKIYVKWIPLELNQNNKKIEKEIKKSIAKKCHLSINKIHIEKVNKIGNLNNKIQRYIQEINV